MKSLIRWGVKLGLVGSILLAGLSGMGNLKANALPEEQVVKTLREIPVFTLTNPKGEFVVLSTRNQDKAVSQVGFFVSKKDAQTFLDNRLKKENPQLASTIQIRPVSLADYYKLVLENRKKPDSSVFFTVVPSQEQVNSARTLLNASGKKEQQFSVPLFVPKFKKDNSYLTIPLPQSNERYIPFYFDKEQVVSLLDQFKQAVPQEAANTEIEVVDLYGVLETLRSSNEAGVKKILLYPSRESIEFIRSLRPQRGGNSGGNTAPTRTAPKK
jgi:nickel transport protein